MKLKYKALVYKATAYVGLDDPSADPVVGAKLTCCLKTDAWHLREAALKELRKEINKELKKVRQGIHG